jgi:hypothetical protein
MSRENGDWRIWRPVIWLTMVGVGVMLVVTPAYLGAIFFGAAIGAGIRVERRRRGIVAKPKRRR